DPAPLEPPEPSAVPEPPPEAAEPLRSTSAGPRGTTDQRRSDAPGYGRRTMPTTVARRPSTTDEAAIPAPASPFTTTRSRPTLSSARQRSPSLWTSVSTPDTRTSRHSWAAVGGDVIVSGSGCPPTAR